MIPNNVSEKQLIEVMYIDIQFYRCPHCFEHKLIVAIESHDEHVNILIIAIATKRLLVTMAIPLKPPQADLEPAAGAMLGHRRHDRASSAFSANRRSLPLRHSPGGEYASLLALSSSFFSKFCPANLPACLW